MSAVWSVACRLISRTVTDENWFIWLTIFFGLALQLRLQFIQNINWDEFYFLSMIYDHQRGELAKPLQTLHVHIFSWLTSVGKDEIQKIEIARFCMWLFEIGTLILIFLTSRLFCSRRALLLGVLCFICSGYVLMHGTSFRADPMAAFLSMLCIYLLAAFPYYFPFIFPASICVIAYGASLVQDKTYMVIFLVLALVCNHLVNYFGRINENQEAQQEVISFLHEAFLKVSAILIDVRCLAQAKSMGILCRAGGILLTKVRRFQ